MGSQRVRLGKRRVPKLWEPEWEGSVQAYTRKFIRENAWRYDPILCTPADLLQDAYIVFQRVKDRYPRVIHPPHFMALYKRSLLNEFIDKSTQNIARKGAFIDMDCEVQELAESLPCNLAEDGAMCALLASAPPEVRLLLSVFANEDHLQELRKPSRTGRGLPRPSLNQRIKRILGLESDADLVAAFRQWLTA